MRPADVLTDVLDLVLGRACTDCDEPGRVLCAACLDRRRGRVQHVRHPSGLTASAALSYDDGGSLVLDYKERGVRSLAPMLGLLLADAIADQCRLLGAREAAVVPIPSHPRPARGFDALGGILRPAARELRSRGLAVHVERGLISGRTHRPLKGLSRAERLAEATAAIVPARPPRSACASPVIVVDDVLTTGATTSAALAALRQLGVAVHGIAVVAATPDTRAPTRAPARPTHR